MIMWKEPMSSAFMMSYLHPCHLTLCLALSYMYNDGAMALQQIDVPSGTCSGPSPGGESRAMGDPCPA